MLVSKNQRIGQRFAVRALANGLSYPRLGMVASRRAVRRAVDRNRSKRIVRETFRALQEELPPLDFVVFCRAAVPKAQSTAAREELRRLFLATGRVDARP